MYRVLRVCFSCVCSMHDLGVVSGLFPPLVFVISLAVTAAAACIITGRLQVFVIKFLSMSILCVK